MLVDALQSAAPPRERTAIAPWLTRHAHAARCPNALTAPAADSTILCSPEREGTCWLGGTTWHGMAAMRISVSNWSTTESDVERSAQAILLELSRADAAAGQ